MSLTTYQLIKSRFPRKVKNKKLLLEKCPQRAATCIRVITRKPRKPNSSQRKIAFISFNKTKRTTFAHIPGEGHNLSSYSSLLIKGAYLTDLPGVKFRVIRGANRYSASPVSSRKVSRSKYGVSIKQKKDKKRSRQKIKKDEKN